ncbi:hypothetical protein PRIC2_008738 [Phytophthora ramorum]
MAATVSAGFGDSVANSSSYKEGIVHAANQVLEATSTGGYLSSFATDEPSESLFQRQDGLAALAPIINVAADLLTKPIPTNKWWGNLIHTTTEDINTVANPAWSNPYALKLPKQAPFGIQACYSYTYRQMADEVNGVVRYYLHEFHNDLTLSATDFGATKPDYEVYSFSDMGVAIRTCVSGSSTTCMDSALVHGMAFVSATYAGLTASIQSDYAMTLLDSSTPGKFVVQLANGQTWVVFASDTSASFSIDSTGSALVAAAAYTGTLRVAILPENSDQDVYDDYASCIVCGGDVSVQSRTSYSLEWETEGSGCDSTGLLHFALPHQVEVMSSATAAQSSGAIVLHSSTRGDMVGQVTTSGSWTLTEDEADDEVDFYPANKPSADVVSQIGLLATLQSDIDSDWSLDTGSWYYNGKAYQNSSGSLTKVVTVAPSSTTAAPMVTSAAPSAKTPAPVATTAAPTISPATPVGTATPVVTAAPATTVGPTSKAPVAEVTTMPPTSQTEVATNEPATASPSSTPPPSTPKPSSPTESNSEATAAPETTTDTHYPGWTSLPPGWTSIPPGWTSIPPGWTSYTPGVVVPEGASTSAPSAALSPTDATQSATQS